MVIMSPWHKISLLAQSWRLLCRGEQTITLSYYKCHIKEGLSNHTLQAKILDLKSRDMAQIVQSIENVNRNKPKSFNQTNFKDKMQSRKCNK